MVAQNSKPSAVDWQRDIYTSGFAGYRSDVKVDLHQLEEAARKKISPQAFGYIAGGAGIEGTMLANRQSFDNYKIVPRMLVDVGERDIGIELFGKRYETPFLLAPIGVLEMAHPSADVAVAKAAAALKIPYIFSNQGSVPMEKAAAVNLESLPADGWENGRTIVRTVRIGSAFMEILDYAESSEIDLIVIGTHGRSGLMHILMGSVAERIVRKSPCPVLTVKPAGHQFVMP